MNLTHLEQNLDEYFFWEVTFEEVFCRMSLILLMSQCVKAVMNLFRHTYIRHLIGNFQVVANLPQSPLLSFLHINKPRILSSYVNDPF